MAASIRYDDFVSNVQPDPAKPESTIMLSGFVGHGPEGHARVFPDPTLGTWYDVPEGDVVYSMPIADSKLGGSYIWVRASSEIKPGSAAPAATPALEAQQQPHAAAMMPTPATHCFICPPKTVFAPCTELCATQFHGCPPHAAIAAAPVGGGGGQAPTPATLCIACPLTVERGCVFTPPQTMCCPPMPMTNCHPFCLTPPPTPTPPHTQCCPPTPATNCIICNVAAPTPLTHCNPCPPLVNHQPTQPPTLCCPPYTQPVALCGVVPQSGIVCSQACVNMQQAAVPAGGGFTAATVCTMPPGCPPHTVHAFCPPNTVNTPCATFVCPTLGVCPTVAACTPNGVFTPFGR
jgi:hypothetical protein